MSDAATAEQSDFDRIIDRTATNSIGVDGYRTFLFDGDDVVLPCADSDAVPMWVADMAFASAPAAIEAMIERIEHPIFGYTAIIDDGLFDAFAGFCDRHYGWRPQREHLVTSPGIVPALYDLVEHILAPDQKVLTLTPAYAFFERAAIHHGRTFLSSALVESDDGNYAIDFDDLEAKLADPLVRAFILCHPHNPTGRVWTEDELRHMAELCLANDVIVVSDEIHCDLLRSGLTHTPLAKLLPETDQIITCMSSSKTFNLAGLGIANVIIPNDEIRDVWLDRNFDTVNPISVAAAIGVFRDGDPWLTQLRSYLDGNFEFVRRTLADRLPAAGFRIPGATYLAWIDLGEYFSPDVDLTRFYAEQAGVLLEGADKFVSDAAGHVRLNLACPRSVLAEGLTRLIASTSSAAMRAR